MALTRPEKDLHCAFQIQPREVQLVQCTSLASNSQIIAGITDGWANISDDEPYQGYGAIVLRDAKTFKQRAVLDEESDENYFGMKLGGLPGNEFIVLTGNAVDKFMVLQEGGFRGEFMLSQMFADASASVDIARAEYWSLEMLGFQNHIIFGLAGKLYLVNFKVSDTLSETNSYFLVSPVRSYTVPGFVIRRPEVPEALGNICLGRGSDDIQPGIFAVASSAEISLWHLDDATSDLKQIQTISTDLGTFYDDVAVSKQYVCASVAKADEIHVFDRASKQKIATLASQYSDDRIFSLQMHVVGALLFSTSFVCSADEKHNGLQAWNLRTQESVFVSRLPEHADEDITAMVKVNGDGYTCFVTHAFDRGVETVWGFPESEEGLRNLQEIVKNHTLVSGPLFQNNRKRKRSKSGGSSRS